LFTDGGGIPEAARGVSFGTRLDGTFALPADPGEYTLLASGEAGLAMQHISVGAEDIRDLTVVLAKAAHVSGRVVIQGATRPTLPVAIEAWSPDAVSRAQREIAVVRNGAFSFDALIGAREFRLASPLPGFAMASVRIRGRDVLDVPVVFKGGENITDALIVLTETPGAVDGRVLDGDRKPVSDVGVVLFSNDRRQLPRRAYWVRPDTTGRFVVSSLAPGDYWLALVDTVDDTRWTTVAYLDGLRDRATRFSLAQGETRSISLTWSAAR
jgi:hypothetical protein